VFLEGIEESERATLEVLRSRQRPDVIFCMGDLHLIGAMHAIHKLKLKVPENISVISISHGFIPTLYNPRVTYVETSGFKLGKLAFEQMLSCLRNDTTPEQVTLASMLVEGGSL
jgi:LacI family transcriptional regulator